MDLNLLANHSGHFRPLNPVVVALVHNAESVIIIITSSFLLRWRKQK